MVDKDEDFEDIVDGVEGKTSHCSLLPTNLKVVPGLMSAFRERISNRWNR